MYQYTFDEKTTDKLKNDTNNSKSVFEKFSEIDDKFNNLTNENVELNLEKIEFERPTKEDVTKSAENSLTEYKNSNINSIQDNYANKSVEIDKNIEETKQIDKERKDDLNETYANIKEDASNDAIKRGLARSSIIVNKLASYDNDMLGKLETLTNETNLKLGSLTTQKNGLEQEKQNALSAFDISYAVKLQEKIDKLNTEISDNEMAITKYNNQVAETKAKWDKQQSDDAFDKRTEIAELFSKYGTTVLDAVKQNEKYSIAKSHFNLMSKNDALEELKNNSNYLTNLGKGNYNKLLQEINEKAE